MTARVHIFELIVTLAIALNNSFDVLNPFNTTPPPHPSKSLHFVMYPVTKIITFLGAAIATLALPMDNIHSTVLQVENREVLVSWSHITFQAGPFNPILV